MQVVAPALGVQIQSFDARELVDIDRAFEAAAKAKVAGLIVTQQHPIPGNAKRIVELAAKRRLPAIYADTPWIHNGGLMSYGPSIPDLHRRAAVYGTRSSRREGHPPTCRCSRR